MILINLYPFKNILVTQPPIEHERKRELTIVAQSKISRPERVAGTSKRDDDKKKITIKPFKINDTEVKHVLPKVDDEKRPAKALDVEKNGRKSRSRSKSAK